MSSLQVSNLEPFLFGAAPVNATPGEAEEVYFSAVREALQGNYHNFVRPPQSSASQIGINEEAIENYLARILSAVRADLVALDARITALEP